MHRRDKLKSSIKVKRVHLHISQSMDWMLTTKILIERELTSFTEIKGPFFLVGLLAPQLITLKRGLSLLPIRITTTYKSLKRKRTCALIQSLVSYRTCPVKIK